MSSQICESKSEVDLPLYFLVCKSMVGVALYTLACRSLAGEGILVNALITGVINYTCYIHTVQSVLRGRW